MKDKKLKSLKKIMKIAEKKMVENKRLKRREVNIKLNPTLEEKENEKQIKELLNNW